MTPIAGTGAWHTRTRGAGHQVIMQIIHLDQASLGSYDNVGGSGFRDSGFDVTSLACCGLAPADSSLEHCRRRS